MTTEEAKSVVIRLERLDPSLDDQRMIAAAVETLCLHWSSALTTVEMRGQLGAPDWTGFERRIWDLGEALRLLLKRRRWHGKGPLLDAVAQILLNRRFGKGRQTFAVLLGDFGGQAYGDILGSALQDNQVWGHVIKALTKARIAGFTAEVAGVQAQERGWIRDAARKYLQSTGL